MTLPKFAAQILLGAIVLMIAYAVVLDIGSSFPLLIFAFVIAALVFFVKFMSKV